MKYTRNPKESRTNFVARIVIEENKPMTAEDIHAVVDKRAGENRGKDKGYWQSFASTAVSTDLIDKTRVVKNHETGGTHVVYHPLGMHPIGEEIPRPLFNRKSKPNFVKVAEDVLKNPPSSTLKKDFDDWNFTKDAIDDFNSNFTKHDMKEPRDAIVSTVQHHFTAEQLLDTLNNLNPDLHDDVLIALFEGLGKPVYMTSVSNKTEHMHWAFINGILVVEE